MALGGDTSLLGPPAATVEELEGEAGSGSFAPATVAQLPRFLRTFFLRFLDEAVDVQIERFNDEERDRISDLIVDLEAREKHAAAWPLLFDFVDLCDYFEDFGLMSVPDAAQEHEVGLFELTARVLHDLAAWAAVEGERALQEEAQRLAAALDGLSSGAGAR